MVQPTLPLRAGADLAAGRWADVADLAVAPRAPVAARSPSVTNLAREQGLLSQFSTSLQHLSSLSRPLSARAT
eukprot:10266587-Lingulodinium_polyedra.AAC.1